MTIDTEIVGKWNFVSSDNFENYMKEAGVGLMTRTIASKLKPTLEFTKNGDDWSMTSVSTFKTVVVKWKLGESFDDKTADGRDVTQLFTVENDRLIQVEKQKSGKDSRFERYIEGGKLIIDCECNGVKCKRVYEKAA